MNSLEDALGKYKLNYVFDPPDDRDRLFKFTFFAEIDPDSLPSKIDLRPNFGDIINQGSLGSCVSNSVVYQLRHLLKKTGQISELMSRLFIYYNGRLQSNYPINEDTVRGVPLSQRMLERYYPLADARRTEQQLKRCIV